MDARVVKAYPWLAGAILLAILVMNVGACFLQLNRQSAQQSSGTTATQVAP